MKKISNIILVLGICSAFCFSACVDKFAVGDAFLEKAPGVDVNIDTVFTSAEYTRNFLWSAYGQLYCTYTSGNMMNGAPIDVLSDSYHCYVSWGGPKQSYYPGLLTENAQDTEDGNFQGKFSYSTKGGLNSDAGGRVSIYETVRKCWQLIENIDRVPDMDDNEKSVSAARPTPSWPAVITTLSAISADFAWPGRPMPWARTTRAAARRRWRRWNSSTP